MMSWNWWRMRADDVNGRRNYGVGWLRCSWSVDTRHWFRGPRWRQRIAAISAIHETYAISCSLKLSLQWLKLFRYAIFSLAPSLSSLNVFVFFFFLEREVTTTKRKICPYLRVLSFTSLGVFLKSVVSLQDSSSFRFAVPSDTSKTREQKQKVISWEYEIFAVVLARKLRNR